MDLSSPSYGDTEIVLKDLQLNIPMRVLALLSTNQEVGTDREDGTFINIGNSPIIFHLIIHNQSMIHERIERDKHPLFLPKNPSEMIYTLDSIDMDLSHIGTETRWKLRDGAKILITREDASSPILKNRIKNIRRNVKDYLETITFIEKENELDAFLRANFPQQSSLLTHF